MSELSNEQRECDHSYHCAECGVEMHLVKGWMEAVESFSKATPPPEPPLTRRERFAMVAMAGSLASFNTRWPPPEVVAQRCTAYADALLAELAKPVAPAPAAALTPEADAATRNPNWPDRDACQ